MNKMHLVFSVIVLIALSAAAAPKLKSIDIKKNGTYSSGKWKYVFTITNQGTKSQGRFGKLYYDGRELPDLNNKRINDYYETPWGEIFWVGKPFLLWRPKGWMPSKKLRTKRPGKKLVPAAAVEHIDLTKSGTYISGKWKYVFTITAKGTKSEKRYGQLYYDGKELLPLSVKYVSRKTPWGEIVQGGVASMMTINIPDGWIPKEAFDSAPEIPPIESFFFSKKKKKQ